MRCMQRYSDMGTLLKDTTAGSGVSFFIFSENIITVSFETA